MYKEHPVFEKPEDENAKIWRYMDFTKFVSLLDRSALFFCRADKLGDPFEGSYPRASVELRKLELEQYIKEGTITLPADSSLDKLLTSMGDNLRKLLEFTSVSCWSLSEYESAALWRLYIKGDQGIAIQSTFNHFKNSFGGDSPDINIGRVKYIDYDNDVLPAANVLYPFIHKRKSFEHEQELRAVIFRFPPFKHDTYMTVNLDTLLNKIYVAPSSPAWFFELVKSVAKKYDLDKKVLQSSLDAKPMY
jgi:hypothetical protein